MSRTKSSQYIESLVSFLLDTKPYHSKLTEIVEEYHFFEEMHVHFEERFRSNIKLSSHWMYNYFSGGNQLQRSFPLQRVVTPTFGTEAHIVGTDENTDIALVPYAYSKKMFDGVGANAVYLRQTLGNTRALTESVDYFQSHGSFQFQIKQTVNANGAYAPLWQETRDDNLIEYATQRTRQLALDIGNVENEYIRVRNLINTQGREFEEWTLTATDTATSAWEVSGSLSGVVGTVIAGQNFAHDHVSFNTTSLAASPPLNTQFLLINPVRAANQIRSLLNQIEEATHAAERTRDLNPVDLEFATADIDREIATLRAVLDVPSLPREYQALLTYIAIASPPVVFPPIFNAAGGTPTMLDVEKLEHEFARLTSPLFFGDFSSLGEGFRESGLPGQRIEIAEGAPLETWNIIKVNPIAHDRATLISTNYGYIVDQNAVFGKITVLDPLITSGDYILTARTGGQLFDLTSLAEPSYTGVAQVNVPFNDGRLAFTVMAGSRARFKAGDSFYISIDNPPIRVDDFDLYYGYDLDPYSDDAEVTPIFFGYNGRFIDYDVDSLNLQVAFDSFSGRRWRMRAQVPAGATPVAQVAAGTEIGMPAGPTSDLLLYHTTEFSVEYSDDDITYTQIGMVNVGETFESALHGISFTLAPASGPFVAASSFETSGPRVEGGDVFSFLVHNPPPVAIVDSLDLADQARLIMHSDSFYAAPPARWTLTFNSPTEYVLAATRVDNGQPVSGTPTTVKLPTIGLQSREGMSFKGLGVHYTIVPSRGFSAGDMFTFETYARKPSFLVHGSVTGFTGDVAYGETYTNGKITFSIEKPDGNTYVNGNLTSIPGFTYTLREDCPSLSYTFTPSSGGYIVWRSDIGVTGFCKKPGTFADQYLTAAVTSTTAGTFKLDVNATNFTLWNGQDVIFLKPKRATSIPQTGEVVLIEKTEDGRLGIALTPSTTNISALSPITIDERFIDRHVDDRFVDYETNDLITLESTSPDTALIHGWLPLTVQKYDSATSIAEFSDPAVLYTFNSAASGKTVGKLKQQDPTNLNEPIIFEWDLEFFNTYLPLNNEANIINIGTGWNDKMRVKVSESIKFMVGGGPLSGEWALSDIVNVDMLEQNVLHIQSQVDDSFSTLIEDGPFAQFLPGYANLPYDDEPNGYDSGVPLTDHFVEAQELAALPSRSADQNQRLQDLLSMIAVFLNGSLGNTTLAQFMTNVEASVGDINLVADDFGYPLRGLGVDISTSPTNSASASIQDALGVVADDSGNPFDSQGFDLMGFDLQGERTAIIFSGSLPPIPTVVLPSSTYETLDTPLGVIVPARVFEISFVATPLELSTLSPTFSVWFPGAAAPVQVPIVERVSLSKFRFSIPHPSAVKIIVG